MGEGKQEGKRQNTYHYFPAGDPTYIWAWIFTPTQKKKEKKMNKK